MRRRLRDAAPEGLGWAGRPRDVRDPAAGIQRNAETFGGPANRGGTYFAMADGSVRLVADDVGPEVLQALSTPAGGD